MLNMYIFTVYQENLMYKIKPYDREEELKNIDSILPLMNVYEGNLNYETGITLDGGLKKTVLIIS